MSNSREDQNNNDRRLNSVVGMGKIVEVNLGDYTARVKDGSITTGWLRMGMARAMGAQMTWPYAVGEEVGYASISGDMQDGFILCALPNGQNAANASADKCRIEAPGGFELIGDIALKGQLVASADIVATNSISLTNHIHPGDSGGETDKPQ